MKLKSLLEAFTAELEMAPALAGRGPMGHEAALLVDGAWLRVSKKNTGLAAPSKLEQRVNSANIEVPLLVEQTAAAWVQRRTQGELLQHILGRWHFLDHEYEVDPQVLVPRPETEILVQSVGDVFSENFPSLPGAQGAEIGLGSGVISIELLARFPALEMLATEVSPGALAVSRANSAALLGAGDCIRLQAFQTDPRKSPCREIEKHLKGRKLQFIVSNPPYLDPSPARQEVEADVRAQEPGMALFAPEGDLLYFYRDIADHAPYLLEKGGFVGVEIPHERAHSLKQLFESRQFRVELRKDLTGRDRVLMAWPSQA